MSTINVRQITTPDGSPVAFPFGIRIGSNGGAGLVNNIGVPGQQGFGVGIAPELPAGFAKLHGTEDPASDAYGNYQFSDGSVMVYIPAFYYRYGTGANGLAINVVDVRPFDAYANVATANAAGYALHRAFHNGGSIRPGVFVDKYLCSNNGGIASSIKNGNPLSSNSANNPFSGLTGAPANNYAGAIAAAKTRGANFFCNSLFINKALALLANAHGSASTGTAFNAWYSAGNTNFPKGCNNNALGDINDATLAFVGTGHLQGQQNRQRQLPGKNRAQRPELRRGGPQRVHVGNLTWPDAKQQRSRCGPVLRAQHQYQHGQRHGREHLGHRLVGRHRSGRAVRRPGSHEQLYRLRRQLQRPRPHHGQRQPGAERCHQWHRLADDRSRCAFGVWRLQPVWQRCFVGFFNRRHVPALWRPLEQRRQRRCLGLALERLAGGLER